ncbi:hypothetical protein HDV06_006862 [Boothiomyces sp. JEL0866]|nr:hypothetical protein HDV06_006862 [Boothiomyces sp. JEL0866]
MAALAEIEMSKKLEDYQKYMDKIKLQLKSIKDSLKSDKSSSKRIMRGVIKELDSLKSDIKQNFKQTKLVYVNEVQWWPKNLKEFYSSTFNVHDGIRKYEPSSPTECPIHPLSMFAQVWTSLYMIYMCIYTVLLPNFLGNLELQFGLVPLSISLTVMVILDTIIIIKTGIILEQELEMEQKTIMNYHIQRKTLIWNFVTCIPYIAFVGSDVQPWKPICLLNGYAFVRYLKSNRTSYLTELHKKIFIEYNLNHQLKNVALVVVVMFVYWCWYAAAMGYMQYLNIVTYEDTGDSAQYFTAWSVLMAFTNTERWLKVVNIVAVVVLLAFFTANVTTYVYQLDSTSRNFEEKLSQIKQFIRFRNLGSDLEERIMQFYLFKFPKRRYFDEEKLLAQLNDPLRKDIAMKQCRNLILQVPFFKQADHSFISQIITYLKIEHYLSGDVIIEQGSYGDEMFFIYSGYVEVIVFGKSVSVLKAGQFFGEIAILLGMTNRTATIRAISNCVIYSLSQSDLELVIDSNPEMSEIIKSTAEARLASDRAKLESEKRVSVKLEPTMEEDEDKAMFSEGIQPQLQEREVLINIPDDDMKQPSVNPELPVRKKSIESRYQSIDAVSKITSDNVKSKYTSMEIRQEDSFESAKENNRNSYKVKKESSAGENNLASDDKLKPPERASSISINMNKATQMKKQKNKEIRNERNMGVLKQVQMISKTMDKEPQLDESDLDNRYPLTINTNASNLDASTSILSPTASKIDNAKDQRHPRILESKEAEGDNSTAMNARRARAQTVIQDIKNQRNLGVLETIKLRNTAAENDGEGKSSTSGVLSERTGSPSSILREHFPTSPVANRNINAVNVVQPMMNNETLRLKIEIQDPTGTKNKLDGDNAVVGDMQHLPTQSDSQEPPNRPTVKSIEFSVEIESPKAEEPNTISDNRNSLVTNRPEQSYPSKSQGTPFPQTLSVSHEILQSHLNVKTASNRSRRSSINTRSRRSSSVVSNVTSSDLKAQRAVGVLQVIRNRTPSAVTGMNVPSEADKEQFSALVSSIKEIKRKSSIKSLKREMDRQSIKVEESKELENVVVSVKIDAAINVEGVLSSSKKSFIPKTFSDDNIQRKSFKTPLISPDLQLKRKSLPKLNYPDKNLLLPGDAANKLTKDEHKRSKADFKPDRYQSAYITEIQELEKIQNEEISNIIGSVIRRQSLNAQALAEGQRNSRGGSKDPRLSQSGMRKSSVMSIKRRNANKSTGSDSSNAADQIVEFIAKTSRSTSFPNAGKTSDFILPVDEDEEESSRRSSAKEHKKKILEVSHDEMEAMSDLGSGIVSETGKKAAPKRKKIVNQILLNAPVEYSRTELLRRFWNKYQPSTSYCPLTPFTPFNQYFYSLYVVVFLVTSILVPFTIAFPEVDLLTGIGITVFIISTFEVLIKLQTCFYSDKGPETVPSAVFTHHLKNGNLIFDVLCGLPWFILVQRYSESNSTVRLICLVHIFPIARIFSVNRPTWIGEKIQHLVRKYSINVSGFQAGKILCAMVLHWKSCIKVMLDRYQDVSYPMFVENMDYISVYSLYFWSVTGEAMYSSCGLTTARSVIDKWLDVFFLTCNATFYAVFVGNIASYIISQDSSGARFHELIEEVEQYIDYKGLGENMKRKIFQYYNLKYSLGKYFDENRILEELNHPLRLSICMKECRPLILKVPFFRDADNGFLSQVVMILKLTYFLPGDMVIEKGTVGDLMFFIASGTLEVVVDVKPVAQLNPGQFFGEIALLFGNMKRTATIRAKTACNLYSLSRNDLSFILQVYPEIAEKMQAVAEERIKITDLCYTSSLIFTKACFKLLERTKNEISMAAGEDIKAQVGEFHNELLKIKAHLTGMRNAIDNLPENEAKSAMLALNKDVDLLKDFLVDDLSKAGINKKDVKLSAEEIKAAFLNKKWFPKNFKQFMQYQYDVNRGLTEYESADTNQCAIHPLSLLSQLWCSLYSIFIAIYAILLPLSLAYPYKHAMLLPLSLYIMGIVIIDTIMVLNTGIIVEQELEMDPKVVYQYHWDSKLLIWNAILGFPYIIIIDAAVQPPGSMENMNWSLICMLNAFIVVRTFTSTRVSWISEMATKLIRKYEINSAIIKSISILTGMAFYWHWFTCSVYFLQLRGVVSELNPMLQNQQNEFEHYTISFFEASSIMFSSGWGVAGPTLTSDRWSKIFNMLFSAFLLALFTANITTFMLRLDSSGRQFTEKLEEVNQYIKYKGLGRDLQQRIVHYYHFKYSKGKYFDEEKILAELNHPLRVVIAVLKECRPLILQVPFFKDADHSFITQVVSQLKVNHFLHDDFIIEQGTTGDQMFFIASGVVEVIVEGKSVTTLKAGQFFGEISLLFGHMKRTASIRAVTECVLYSLSQSDLEIILDINPNMAAMMKKTAEERLSSNKVGVVMVSKNTAALVDRSYSIDPHMSRKNSVLPTQGALDILAAKKAQRKQSQIHGSNPHFHTSSLETPMENEGEEELPTIPMNPESPFYHTDSTSKNKILEQVESIEIKEVLSAVKRKSSVQNFLDRSFISKHISNENIEVDPELMKSIEFLGSKNNKKSLLSLVVPEVNEEKVLAAAVLPEDPSEDDLNEGKAAPKEKGSKILATAEAATPSNDVKIDLKDKDDFDDEDDKPKVTQRKIMQQNNESDPIKGNNTANMGNMNEQTMGQKMVRLWNKYQPSMSYCPLHPSSLFSRIANSIFTVVYLIVAIVLPVSFGFETQTDVLPGISVVVFITSLFDFLLKLQTGYRLHQEVEMEPKKLLVIYWKNGSFIVDFITGFPWVFIVDAAVTDPVLNNWWRLVCLVHAFPLVRILVSNRSSWIADYMTDWVRRNDVNISAVQAGKILFTMSLYWHWHTCSANFLIRMQAIPNAFPIYNEAEMYTLHFWSSATEMLNTGCGAVPPKVPLDRWLKILNMICNVSLMSLFVGNISSFMIGLDSSGRQFNEQLEQVGQYITYKGLGRELKKKILDYYQLKYSLGKYFDETKILSELNHPLRLAIYMRECRALIIQVPFFKGADNGFISQVVMILKPAHFLKDDLVIEKGTAGDLMFFIASGTLEVVVNNVAVAQLSPGQFFGEIALLFGNMKRTASIRATSSCNLYSLSRSDLNFILEVYPEMAEKMQKIAEERIASNLGKKE